MPKANVLNKDLILSRITVSESGCWVWDGSCDSCGYGAVMVRGKNYGVHRLSAHLWLDFDLKSKLNVCHKCDNPPCCNPNHLFIDTHRDNMLDMCIKGRHVDSRGSKHGMAKLDESDVLLIRALSTAGWSHADAGRVLGINRNHACDIITRRIWKYI